MKLCVLAYALLTTVLFAISATAFGLHSQSSTCCGANNLKNHSSCSSSSTLAFGVSTSRRAGGDLQARSSSSLAVSRTDEASSTSSSSLPSSVAAHITSENWSLLSDRGKSALQNLIESEESGKPAQGHVYGNWPDAGTEDEGKIQLAEQLADLDASYPGGLTAYILKAKSLLRDSAEGTNPFKDFVASIPAGEILNYDSDDDQATGMTFSEAEKVGLTGIADVAFVLVAGGLGERLGYSGIKLSLETNLCNNMCYLELYTKYIQAMERMAELKAGKKAGTIKLPLVIMTSGDTDSVTRDLLKDNDNFGLDEGQVSIVCQDKVPALRDSNAGLSLDGRWKVETKPHGHGDVHHLLFREGHVEKWDKEGRRYVVFLQDTNGLVVNSILPTLGVSIQKGFHMNSLCIPRLAKEAAGAITKLEHESDPEKSLVINVEYNQLGPLLKTQFDGKGDIADPQTGFSPYPGNANNLVIEMKSYAKTLRGEDQGVVLEFVNPKYKDDSRTEFKKPTRLECMMQDIPKLFQKEMGSDANIGFTMFDRWFTFSPAKNSVESGIEAVEKGSTAPGTVSSAESDMYIQNQRKLKFAGMDTKVTEPSDMVKVGGIPVTPGPRVVLCPAFAVTQEEILTKIRGGSITERSTLVLEGEGLVVKNLQLDGALIIRTGLGCNVVVDGLIVKNKGYELEEVQKGVEVPETVKIRGYTMAKHEAMEIYINEPGNYIVDSNGVVNKLE